MQNLVVEALKARFAALSREESAVLGFRGAFRVAPVALGVRVPGEDRLAFARRRHALFRELLCMGVAATEAAPEFQRAASAARAETSVLAGLAAEANAALAKPAMAEASSEALQLDFLMIEGGPICPFVAPPTDRSGAALSAAELRALPVWHEGAPEAVAGAWTDARERLLALGLGFEVWTDWYESRLDGWPATEPWERAWALQPSGAAV